RERTSVRYPGTGLPRPSFSMKTAGARRQNADCGSVSTAVVSRSARLLSNEPDAAAKLDTTANTDKRPFRTTRRIIARLSQNGKVTYPPPLRLVSNRSYENRDPSDFRQHAGARSRPLRHG